MARPVQAAAWPWVCRSTLAALLLAIPAAVFAAPDAELWPRWQQHVADSHKHIDYSAWNAFLHNYVVTGDDGLNRVRYGAVSAADRQALEDFLTQLQAIDIDAYNRAVQRAFWINLYNAATVVLILRHYPLESIRDIDLGGWFSFGPWGEKWLQVEAVALSLDDIEHRILRPIWHTPLLHYSLNCASVGCPNLVKQAFTASNFKTLARANARAYINSPRGVKVVDGRLDVSSLYVWFKADFGGSDAAVIAHLGTFASATLARQLAGITKISADHYDWSLNAVR